MAKKASESEAVKKRITLLRERYKKCVDADRDNRDAFTEDMKFALVPGEQWDDFSKRERGDDRPMYEFNRTRTTIKRVVNSMRNNPVYGKVRAVEDGDKETAEVYEGLIRNIANNSNFDAIRDAAAEYQVTGGYAAWRIVTKYSDDTAFDQDICIEALRNPLCLYCDPTAFEQTGRDAKYWILTDKITTEQFEAQYPDAEPHSFETEFEDDEDWRDDDKVRIAEHWYQVPVEKNIYMLSDGRSIGDDDLQEAMAQKLQIVKQRSVRCYDIYSAIYSGDAELTKPAKWPGKHFPWIRLFGEYIIVNGKCYWNGLTRHIKDAQRVFNVAQTSVAEAIARASISQVWATAEQAKGLSKHWAEASKKNLFAQIYNADPKAPGPPVRMPGVDVPVAAIQNAQMMGDEIKADSGIFDASLGNQSNETSGVAIQSRAAQGEMATFNFPANMANAVRRTWEIIVDLIPMVIDTPRAIRILGADDADKYVRVNHPDEQGNIINDLSRGKFDVIVTTGPSFASKRQEAVQAYSEMGKSNPALMAVASDLIIKGMDLPYSDQIADRIRATLPPQIQAIINGGNKSPEVQQAMMLADQAMQQVQQQGQMVQAAAEEAQKVSSDAQADKAAADKAKADVAVAAANLKVQEAELARDVAKFQELVAKSQMQLMQQQQTATGDANVGEREQLSAELQQALANIQEQAAQHMQQSAQLLEQAVGVVAQTGQQAVGEIAQAVAPQKKTVRTKRVNGKLVGEVVSEDGTSKTVTISRENNGELVGMITPTPTLQ